MQEEPVSEDLAKAAFDNAQKNYKEGFRGATMQAFTEGAQWQSRQDEKNIGELQWNAHEEGWDECKQEIIENAVKVKITNSSIISLPSDCYFKVGDKVLIIKENIFYP
jgi:hypothetical protein